jgi:hypothetical protein
MKLKLWMVVAIMLLGLWLPVSKISAATESRYFEFDAATGTIVNYDPSGPKDVVIPKTIQGVAVQKIGRAAFAYRRISSVVIPDSVREVSDGAFLSNRLTQIAIPSSVQTIGAQAFSENRIYRLTLPDSVREMGEQAFLMNALVELKLSRSLSRIPEGAFAFNNLSEVEIPDSVVEIDDAAFANNSLKKILIPNSVTQIKMAAFMENELTEIIIPGSVTRIGKAAFEYNQLTRVEIPDSVGDIVKDAFHNNSLTSVSVGHYCLCEDAFDPNVSVARREPTASSFLAPLNVSFAGAATVREVSETDLAYELTATIKNPNPVAAHHVRVSMDLPAGASITEGDPIVALGDLGANERQVITWKFQLPIECLYQTEFVSFTAEGGNFAPSFPVFLFQDAWGYEKIREGDYTFNKTTGTITGYSNSGPKDVVIPNQIAGVAVKGIGDLAFKNKNLTSVSFPDSLIFIGYAAFSGNQLKRVELPNSLRILKTHAFQYNQLKEVILSESLTVIPYLAFYNNQLAEITIPKAVVLIENDAFHFNPLTSVLLPAQCLLSESSAFDMDVQVKRRWLPYTD